MSSSSVTAPLWIELEGAANVRDVGGLPSASGETVRPGRLIRADNLQTLTAADVRHLVDDLGVAAVADLRTGVEVDSEGPGPLTREPRVDVVHLSLFPELGNRTDAAAPGDGPVILPWQQRDNGESNDAETSNGAASRAGASAVYLRYLDERPDSILAALRLIAHTDGATIVNCAAGKDRTGTVVALALAEVGVTPDAIVEDYARSDERIAAIFGRLARSRTYVADVEHKLDDVDRHRPRAETMRGLLAAIDDLHGGVPAWLRANGWTDDDAAALRRGLLAG